MLSYCQPAHCEDTRGPRPGECTFNVINQSINTCPTGASTYWLLQHPALPIHKPLQAAGHHGVNMQSLLSAVRTARPGVGQAVPCHLSQVPPRNVARLMRCCCSLHETVTAAASPCHTSIVLCMQHPYAWSPKVHVSTLCLKHTPNNYLAGARATPQWPVRQAHHTFVVPQEVGPSVMCQHAMQPSHVYGQACDPCGPAHTPATHKPCFQLPQVCDTSSVSGAWSMRAPTCL